METNSQENQGVKNMDTQKIIIIESRKSIGVAFLLTFFFGPFGMLYSTVVGGIIMLIASVVVGLVTFGFGVFITWPICIIWGMIAADNHNKRISNRIKRLD